MYSYNTLILHYCEMSIFFDIFYKKNFKKNIDKEKNLCYNERRNSSCAWRFNSASPQVRE